MIYFILGTKAQLIKTFPVMQQLQRLGIPWSYIDTVQHGPICESLRRTFALREPEHFLVPKGTLIERTQDAVVWALQVLWHGWRRRREIFPVGGLVVVHGDTLSTLVGALLGWLCGQPVCHLEAGERTYNWRRPFPEEIIRRLVDAGSSPLLACGDVQTDNLRRERRRGRIVNLGANTLIDAAQSVADASGPGGTGPVVVSIHRFETITDRTRMEFLVRAVELIAQSGPAVWGVHPPTRRKLVEFGLWPRLEQLPNLTLRDLFDYPDFIRAIHAAKFLMTDGGGPQEESHFLGTPCLLLRSETERIHPNVRMAGWDHATVREFLADPAHYRRPPVARGASPSRRAADEMMAALRA